MNQKLHFFAIVSSLAIAIVAVAQDIGTADTFDIYLHDLDGKPIDEEVTLTFYQMRGTQVRISDSVVQAEVTVPKFGAAVETAGPIPAAEPNAIKPTAFDFSFDLPPEEPNRSLVIVAQRKSASQPTAIVPFVVISIANTEHHSLHIAVQKERPTPPSTKRPHCHKAKYCCQCHCACKCWKRRCR